MQLPRGMRLRRERAAEEPRSQTPAPDELADAMGLPSGPAGRGLHGEDAPRSLPVRFWRWWQPHRRVMRFLRGEPSDSLTGQALGWLGKKLGARGIGAICVAIGLAGSTYIWAMITGHGLRGALSGQALDNAPSYPNADAAAVGASVAYGVGCLGMIALTRIGTDRSPLRLRTRDPGSQGFVEGLVLVGAPFLIGGLIFGLIRLVTG